MTLLQADVTEANATGMDLDQYFASLGGFNRDVFDGEWSAGRLYDHGLASFGDAWRHDGGCIDV